MTRTTSDLSAPVEAPRVGEVPARRVDAAHEPANVPQPTDALPVEAPVIDLSFDAAAQVQHQASQLAAHLVARQRELDHRQASLHAQIAEWERDQAIARLSLEERQLAAQSRDAELIARATELDARERALRQRETEFRTAQVESEFFLQRQEEELDLRESQVRLVEERLANEQRIVKKTAAELRRARERFRLASRRISQRLEQRRIEWEQMTRGVLASLEQRRVAIEQSARNGGDPADDAVLTEFEETEQLRAALRMELLAVRRLLDEREAEAADWAKTQAEFFAEQQVELDRLAAREGELALLSAELDARREALDRAERELDEQGPSSKCDANRQSREHELQELRDKIAEEFARLSKQQAEFAAWATSREHELKEQAQNLAKQQQSLDRRATEFRKQEIAARLERLSPAGKRSQK